MRRREFTNFFASTLAGTALLGGRVFAQSSPGISETPKDLLTKLITDPQWTLPTSDNSAAAQQFFGHVDKERKKIDMHAGIERLLANDGEHLRMVLATAEKYGVPRGVVFLALAESRWTQYGENNALAAGYWQFIPATARMFGLHVPRGESKARKRSSAELLERDAHGKIDERLDPVKSTDAAMRYLKYLKRFFEDVVKHNNEKHKLDPSKQFTVSENNLWTFAFWAYNRGPGHVRKTFLQTKGNPLLYPTTLLAQPIPNKSSAPRATASRLESVGYVSKIGAICEAVTRFARKDSSANVVSQKSIGSGIATKQASQGANGKQKVAPEPKSEQKIATPDVEPPEHAEQETDEDIEFIPYRVQGGDNLTKIATWLSPDQDFVQLRMDQIWDANPQIHNRPRYLIKRGMDLLHIPAQRVPVEEKGGTAVLLKYARMYYPGVRADVAVNYIRYINGILIGSAVGPGSRHSSIIVPLQHN